MAGRRKRGFVQLDNDLFLRAAELELRPIDIVVVCVIEARRNSKTGKSFASYTKIGESLGRSSDAVKESVKRMRARGLLTVQRRHDPGGHARGYEYDFTPLFERLERLPSDTAQQREDARQGDSSLEGENAPQGTDALQGKNAEPNRAPTLPEQDVGNNTNDGTALSRMGGSTPATPVAHVRAYARTREASDEEPYEPDPPCEWAHPS